MGYSFIIPSILQTLPESPSKDRKPLWWQNSKTAPTYPCPGVLALGNLVLLNVNRTVNVLDHRSPDQVINQFALNYSEGDYLVVLT